MIPLAPSASAHVASQPMQLLDTEGVLHKCIEAFQVPDQPACACAACIATMVVSQIPPRDGSDSQEVPMNREHLRNRARWIRDDLDPIVASDGADILHADNVITLFTFFEELRASSVPLETIRYSRLHYALLEIAGRATRWPTRLIECASEIIKSWESLHGPLIEIRTPLFDPGGRLHGISTPEDLEREKLLVKWLQSPDARVAHSCSRRHGDIGFKPGDWWITSMYAFHDGIIDTGNSDGGITCCRKHAYAILLTHDDEIASPDPDHFTYRPKYEDLGKYRLTSATTSSRQPIRILRSHTLHSFWSPRAGVRYDGLYRVSGWVVKYDPKTHKLGYDINFTREESQPPMKAVLARPFSEEVDDYKEYKRIRHEVRLGRNTLSHARPLTSDFARSRSEHKPLEEVPSSPRNRKRSSLFSVPIANMAIPVPASKYSEGVDDRVGRNSVDIVRHDSFAKGKLR